MLNWWSFASLADVDKRAGRGKGAAKFLSSAQAERLQDRSEKMNPGFTTRAEVAEFINKWHLSYLDSELDALDRAGLDDEHKVLEILEHHVRDWEEEWRTNARLRGQRLMDALSLTPAFREKYEKYQANSAELKEASDNGIRPDDPDFEELRASVEAQGTELKTIAKDYLQAPANLYAEGSALLKKLKAAAVSGAKTPSPD
jgi:hypothetical protein